MKKTKLILVILILLLNFCVPAFAKNYGADVIVSMQIGNPIMQVNGENAQIDEGRGTSPIILDSRTLVPVRSIIEAFGGRVNWDEKTKSVTALLNSDRVILTINSKEAYFNKKLYTLDTVPVIINDRTMLPIRFIAESFNLGVAWQEKNKTVWIISNSFEEDEYLTLMEELPRFSGKPYAEINNNVPYFKDYEIIGGSFEFYGSLDSLGRCDVAFSSVAKDIMPTEKRGNISSVKPTGWVNNYYDFVEGKSLYNRCHLIGFQLTGENANRRNLITGTRYMNTKGMLPFENMIDDYIEETGNHVMYRVSPVFTGENLVADGVLMEAYSVEDKGEGIKFCVFCYNVQPKVKINYLTGENEAA